MNTQESISTRFYSVMTEANINRTWLELKLQSYSLLYTIRKKKKNNKKKTNSLTHRCFPPRRTLKKLKKKKVFRITWIQRTILENNNYNNNKERKKETNKQRKQQRADVGLEPTTGALEGQRSILLS